MLVLLTRLLFAWNNENVNKSAYVKKKFPNAIPILGTLLGVSVLLNVCFLIQKNSSSKLPVSLKCVKNGFLTKEEFLAHYTVRRGETLAAIAQVQVHDSSRAQEIYLLNIDQLGNQLFDPKAALSEGMTLLVPPEEVRFSSAKILGIEGRLVKIQGNSFLISPKVGLTISLYADQKTKLERKFKVGDCVEAIYYGDNSNQAAWIFPQT